MLGSLQAEEFFLKTFQVGVYIECKKTAIHKYMGTST